MGQSVRRHRLPDRETSWAEGQGVSSSNQFLADVNGDGKADLVLFWGSSGTWYVSLSSGNGFGSPQLWSNGNGAGSNDQFVADFTGDAKADAAVYFASNGNWYIGPSTGSLFVGPTNAYPFAQWSVGHACTGSCTSLITTSQRLVGKVGSDAKADATYFRASDGYWWVGQSSGGGFYTPTPWASGHGVGTSERFLGDVAGDGKDDMILFDVNQGDWNVSTSDGNGFAATPGPWVHGHGAGS